MDRRRHQEPERGAHDDGRVRGERVEGQERDREEARGGVHSQERHQSEEERRVWIRQPLQPEAHGGVQMLMLVMDEGHLLNISVRADVHGRGFGRALLDRVVSMARELGLTSILLEVRPSNTRALSMYVQYGFMSIGRRKAYYPAPENTREDAIVMRLSL